jgi:hypothetical protein
MNTKLNQFHVQINHGSTQVIETRTGKYWLAAAAALAILEHEPSGDMDIVKIWMPNLLPQYGPYFYVVEKDSNEVGQLYGDDSRKW